MNKKQFGTIIAAGVLTLGLATSYAYFTSSQDGFLGNDGENLAALTITNGKVEVSAKATGSGTTAADWSYDVVKYSTGGYGEATGETLTAFQNQHRSPDISVGEVKLDGTSVESESFKRANIGAAITGAVVNARPGDAIVLGTDDGKGNVGLQVTNSSNLTVKMQLILNNDSNAQAELAKLTAAGWKMYVNGNQVDLIEGAIIDATVVPSNGSQLLDVRFELPLGTTNDYQEKSTSTESSTGIDFSKLFTLRATQENNPGWDEAAAIPLAE